MHGVILYSLGKYISERHGTATWKWINASAGTSDPYFVPTKEYPDEQAMALLRTAAQITGEPLDGLLVSFGAFLVPPLLDLYGALIQRHWRTLELIEHTEETVHRIVRMRATGAAPPVLMTRRTGPEQVTVYYQSARRLCHLAAGIIQGVARHYGDSVAIRQPLCMHRGADHCELVVQLLRKPEKVLMN